MSRLQERSLMAQVELTESEEIAIAMILHQRYPMHRLNEITARLTPAQVKDVETYAESLAARHTTESGSPHPDGRPNRIRLDELDGLLTRMTDDMPWPEIKKRIRNEFADAAED